MSIGFQNSDAFFDGFVIKYPYDEPAVQKVIESDPVVQKFLNHHPSSTFEYSTSNYPNLANPYSKFWHIGSNVIEISGSTMNKNDAPENYKVYQISLFKDAYKFRVEGKNLEFMKKDIVKNYFP